MPIFRLDIALTDKVNSFGDVCREIRDYLREMGKLHNVSPEGFNHADIREVCASADRILMEARETADAPVMFRTTLLSSEFDHGSRITHSDAVSTDDIAERLAAEQEETTQ